MSRDALLRRLAFLAIALAVVIGAWSGLHAPFVYDDKVEVIGNPTIRSVANWRAVVTYNVSRPLLVLTYAWNFGRFGLEPLGYHLTSLAIHLLAVAAALSMAEGVGRLAGVPAPLGSAVAAVGLWAVHPMGTEAVTYITGRSESLAALFCFLALAAWAAALDRERAGRAAAGLPFRLAGLLAFVGAVGSKEVGAMTPLAMAAMELVLARPGPGRRRWVSSGAWYLVFALVLVGAGWLRLQHADSLLPREVDRPLPTQLATSAAVWLRYLGLWLAPIGQTIFHHQLELSPANPGGLASIGLWSALVLAGVSWGRRTPAAGWALLTGALFLVPSTSFVPLKETMAEHRAYQTGLWLFLAVAWTVRGQTARRLATVAVPAGLLLIGLTWRRNVVWSSEVALWREATQRGPLQAEAWYGLGDALRFAGRFDAAGPAYQRALELDPEDIDAWVNLGIARAEAGDDAGAEKAWRAALQRTPSDCRAHNNLGFLAWRRQEYDLAIAEFTSSLAYCPDDTRAHYGLGNAYYGPRRDPERAVLHYEALLAADPQFPRAEEVREKLLELTW